MSIKARFTEDRGGMSFGDLKFGLGIVAAFAVAFIVFHKPPPPPTTQELAAQAAAALVPVDPQWSSVCAVAQIEIEDRLKSPGSGSFDGCHIVSVSADKKTVVVMGSVTAANAFNARIRSTYAATIVKKPEASPRDNDFSAYRLANLAM